MSQQADTGQSYWFRIIHGHDLPTGRFSWNVEDGTLHWSEEVYRQYGFEPGEVVPTMELLMAHKHPGDASVIAGLLERVARTGERFTVPHRIIDAAGRTRYVVSVGGAEDAGTVRRISGYTFDITGLRTADAQLVADEAVHQAREHMALIEQAKGALRAMHGIGPDEAYAILVRDSQRRNVKVHQVALQLLDSHNAGAAMEGKPANLADQGG